MGLEIVRKSAQTKERGSSLWRRSAALVRPKEEKAEETSPPAEAESPVVDKPPLWRVGLIVAASALCGGIAVVLWNRRLLTRMRDSERASTSEQARGWDDTL